MPKKITLEQIARLAKILALIVFEETPDSRLEELLPDDELEFLSDMAYEED